ncbi:MAG TPA: DUF3306 domain-containing protein [Usitatibacter sp.]|nr:DUF3306 domain-containing protein [Usitatibacter sp.]
MSAKDEGFLARWSRRKVDARTGGPTPPEAPAPAPADPALAQAAATATPSAAVPELPPVESLTPHSDFSPFMRADVDPALKGRALKTLFSDPALYPMDGLDVYIDDYTKPDPLPEGWLEKLNQFATLHGEPQPAAAEAAQVADESEGRVAAPAPAPLAAEPHAGPGTEDGSDTSTAPATHPDDNNRAAT